MNSPHILPEAAEPCRTHRLLIVDDEPLNRELLAALVESLGHVSEEAASGEEALDRLGPDIDLVLLDVRMPDMDGFQVAQAIRAHPQCGRVPIIMVTALSSRQDRLCAVEAGANDFITKPIDRVELRVRTDSLLRMKCAQDAVERYQRDLEEIVETRTQALRDALTVAAQAQREAHAAHLDTVHRLAVAAEYRDGYTSAHLHRVSLYCTVLGRAAGLSEDEVETLFHASVMHDVGKIGVPDAILLKPGRLTTDEFDLMKQHTLIGTRILSGSTSPLLQAGETIALSHHERWDGSGYPGGLSGEDIPLAGRICAIADVFDALTSARPYKPAFPLERAFALMREGRGIHFDPHLLDLFLEHHDTIVAIWEQGQEPPCDSPEDAMMDVQRG